MLDIFHCLCFSVCSCQEGQGNKNSRKRTCKYTAKLTTKPLWFCNPVTSAPHKQAVTQMVEMLSPLPESKILSFSRVDLNSSSYSFLLTLNGKIKFYVGERWNR